MNFRELTREEAAFYERIKAREAMINTMIRGLAVVAMATMALTLAVLFW